LNENTLKILEKKLIHFRKETSKRLTSFFFSLTIKIFLKEILPEFPVLKFKLKSPEFQKNEILQLFEKVTFHLS